MRHINKRIAYENESESAFFEGGGQNKPSCTFNKWLTKHFFPMKNDTQISCKPFFSNNNLKKNKKQIH